MKRILMVFFLTISFLIPNAFNATERAEDKANKKQKKVEIKFLSDINGWLEFGQRLVHNDWRINYVKNRDECLRYANMGVFFTLVQVEELSFFLGAENETWMLPNFNFIYAAPAFQDYYLTLMGQYDFNQSINLFSSFQHLCGHTLDTLPRGDSVETWEKFDFGFAVQGEWLQKEKYLKVNFDGRLAIAKYMPIYDCDWQNGLDSKAGLKVFVHPKAGFFFSLTDEIKTRENGPAKQRLEFRQGFIFPGKMANLTICLVKRLDSAQPQTIEFKIWR